MGSWISLFDLLPNSSRALAEVCEKAANGLKRHGKSVMLRIMVRKQATDLEGGTHERFPLLPYFPKEVAITDRLEQKGLAAMVCVSLTLLKELLHGPRNKRFQIIKLYFELALTMCLEVTHAIDLAIEFTSLKFYVGTGVEFLPVPFSQPFHEGQRGAKIGFFWKNRVISGACS